MPYLRQVTPLQRDGLGLLALWLLSLPVKLIASARMPFDHDFVPVVMLGWQWLMGGDMPAYGTLSSVSAYNMPMLVWLYTPAQVVFTDIAAGILATGLLLNLLGAVALWAWVRAMFGRGMGLWAGALFLFSESAISGSYTAWAQVQLPVFFAISSYCAWRWWTAPHARPASVWLALMGISAFSAFMVHFAAVMLFAGLLVASWVARARWTWQGLLGGALVCALLIAPYMVFQIERDGVDIRAFLTRQSPIPPQELNAIRDAVFAGVTVDAAPSSLPVPAPTTDLPPAPPTTRLERGIAYLFSLPMHLWRVIMPYDWQRSLWDALAGFFLFISLGHSLMHSGRALWRVRGRWWRVPWLDEAWGRALLILMMMMGFALGLLATRNPPDQQPTYYYGMTAWHIALIAYGAGVLVQWAHRWGRAQWGRVGVAFALMVMMGAMSYERINTISTWDEGRTDAANIWLYRHVVDVAGTIAHAYEGATDLTIAYDILTYQPQLWWVVAWHGVDATYRAGMPFDAVLKRVYGITNANTGADGMVDDMSSAHAIVTTRAGMAAYAGAYDAHPIGGLVVLLPASG